MGSTRDLGVHHSGTCMFKQKVHNQGLDGIVDKVHTLVINQDEWVVESCKDKFIHELCYDRYSVCSQHFGLYPLGSVINCH